MFNIQYPEPDFKLKKEKDRDFIFDPYRKIWLRLTGEEWVRQNFIAYLVKELQYPASLIAIEKEIMLGELKKRFDILVYDPSFHPWMMIECKAPSVPLSASVLQQVLRYNISLPVTYLVITNGNFSMAYSKYEGDLVTLQHLPTWEVASHK
ncbi:MAG: type I restriction enzyme HsdR N-terminal domain-containing protein [Chitinophagaceae bacterium]|jgi:hypothetical protein|nr:type I restriction enzyme HsdR N-terminal domain-containing protein [Chitinophagaceae bacterium]